MIWRSGFSSPIQSFPIRELALHYIDSCCCQAHCALYCRSCITINENKSEDSNWYSYFLRPSLRERSPPWTTTWTMTTRTRTLQRLSRRDLRPRSPGRRTTMARGWSNSLTGLPSTRGCEGWWPPTRGSTRRRRRGSRPRTSATRGGRGLSRWSGICDNTLIQYYKYDIWSIYQYSII